MSRHKNIFIITDIDIDGAMSYLLFSWFKKCHIPYISTRVNDLKKTLETWIKNGNLKKYDQVYILDLDCSQECMHLVDTDKFTIVDHHDTHVQNKDKYKHATTFIEHTPSCSKLIYKLLQASLEDEITIEQKRLVLMVDDYDSYKLKIPGSHELNTLFWNYQGDRLARFNLEFRDGFAGFNEQQKNIISFYKRKIQRVIGDLTVFDANLPIDGTPYKFVSTMATECINDVAHHIIESSGADIGIVVNTNSNKVSFRKDKNCPVNLSELAKRLTNGGGHTGAAGGTITETFLSFTKMFAERK